MITYKMHLIQAGRTAYEPERRYLGQLDVPLSAEGIRELELLKEEFRYPRAEVVFTSSLERSVRTGEILYPDTFAQEVEDLREMGLGEFEGRTIQELQEDEAFNAWLANSAENSPPGGEGMEAYTRRIVTAVQGIFGRMMQERITSAAVVTDGGVILSLLAGIGLPKQPMGMWTTQHGTGYTLLFTSQMWMRDRCAEVFARIPELREEDGGM